MVAQSLAEKMDLGERRVRRPYHNRPGSAPLQLLPYVADLNVQRTMKIFHISKGKRKLRLKHHCKQIISGLVLKYQIGPRFITKRGSSGALLASTAFPLTRPESTMY